MKKILPLIFLISLLGMSCSQFSNSITSRSWHNMNAKYNALWIAKVNYEFVVDTLFQSRTEDYTKQLPVFLPIDTLRNSICSKEIEEVLLKASLVAERHSNSKYLDEAYMLLGNTRLLKGDFLNASEIYKYINTNGKKDKFKHAALIALMRACIETDDLGTANEVSNVLKILPLKGENISDYYLTKAYYHQKANEPLLTAAILEEAVKVMKKGEKKARIYFIIGQIYEQNGRPELAISPYENVLKNKPNYDLTFNATVNKLGSLSSGSSNRNSNNLTAFEKMLSDRKNADLKGNIYLKMGEIEAEKSNYSKAINYFYKSKEFSKTADEESTAYLAIANLYYDDIQDYDKASLYYDSTLTKMPQTHVQFKDIVKKASSLSSFIFYKNVLALEDSLQSLAKLNPLLLDRKLDEAIVKQEQEKQQMIELMNQKNRNTIQRTDAVLLANRWQLYDPVKLNSGKSAFIQKWGTRELTDNWRRRDQQAGSLSIKLEKLNEAQIKKEEEALAALKKEEANKSIAQNAFKKKELLEKIPTTPEKLAASQVKQQEAYFQLGKIYNFQFNEKEKAQTTFQTLISKFPEGVYTPEALYFLAIMAEDKSNNPFKTALISKYPSSTFAKQLEKGIVVISSSMENDAKNFYKELFEVYSTGNYQMSLSMANQGLSTHFGTSVEDKIAFLKLIILGKGNDIDAYKTALSDFKLGYPSSNYLNRVQKMEEALIKQ